MRRKHSTRLVSRNNEVRATAARQDADRRRSEAEYEAYGALIGLAAAKIDENALGQARFGACLLAYHGCGVGSGDA